MKIFSLKIKVRYCETDQMGLVHHGSYVNYFEEARISWISNLGLSYSEMEKSGIILLWRAIGSSIGRTFNTFRTAFTKTTQ